MLRMNLSIQKRDPVWPSCWRVWHLITGCHLCVNLTSTSGNAEDLSQYDCREGLKYQLCDNVTASLLTL